MPPLGANLLCRSSLSLTHLTAALSCMTAVLVMIGRSSYHPNAGAFSQLHRCYPVDHSPKDQSTPSAQGSGSASELILRSDIPEAFLFMGDSIHYRATSPTGAHEWEALVPDADPTVPGSSSTVYTVSMLHQLQCLRYIRDDYVTNKTSGSSRHCINYLRQVLLCHASTRIEPVHTLKGPGYVDSEQGI
jgi:hypothetical protein